MSVLETPPLQPGDDLDGLLRAFLRSQMPQPWPPPRWDDRRDAGPTVHRAAAGRTLMRSRWALAASVAMLLCGSWLLPNRFTSDAKSDHGAAGPMIGTDLRREFQKNHKQKGGGEQNKPGLAVEEGDQLPGFEPDVPRFR